MLPGTAAPVAEDMEEEEAAPTAAEAALRDQMARQTARHLVEMRALREERDFYLRKLARHGEGSAGSRVRGDGRAVRAEGGQREMRSSAALLRSTAGPFP